MSKMVSTGTGGLTGSKFRPPQEQAIRELLTKHACPHGYHAVRTYLLGSIARPAPTVKPLDAVARLWGGIFPDFESLDDMDALLGAIVVGLWNELSTHRNPEMPFKVVALPMEPTAINLSNFALVRAQEAEGFVEGLFGGDLSAALPERAHEAVAYLYDIRSLMLSVDDLMKSATFRLDDPDKIQTTLIRLNLMTEVMEVEINAAVTACSQIRMDRLSKIASSLPTLH